MISRILKHTLQEFKNSFFPKRDKDDEEFKLFERLVNYVLISKTLPEAFEDKATFDLIDVDKNGDSTFGIDTFALIVNDALVTSVEQIEDQRVSNILKVRFIFIQSKYSESLNSGEVLKFITAVKDLLSENSKLPSSNSLKRAKSLIEEIYSFENAKLFKGSMPSCDMYFANAGSVSADSLIEGILRGAEKEIASSSDIKECSIKHINEQGIIDSWNEIENRKEVFVTLDNIIPCGDIEKVEQAYIGFLKLQEFIKIIVGSDGNIRKNIFYENVRDFQGVDNQVNSEIEATLNNPTLYDKFVLLNNGITIVAKQFSNIKSKQYQMNDYCIVNGCQTSNMLFKNKELIGQSEVLDIPIKIIHTENNNVIERIIRSTNRQTPVPDEAFVSFDNFHKGLQKFYVTFPTPVQKLYYERRSGEYRHDSNIENQRIVSLHSQIRSYASIILGNPYLASTRNPSLILKGDRDNLFQDGHSYYPYYISSYLYFWFFQLVDMGVLDREYSVSRYWICWIVRMYLTKGVKAKLSSDYDEYYEGLMSELNDFERLKDLFTTSCLAFDTIKRDFRDGDTDKSLIRQRNFCDSVKDYIGRRRFL